MVAPLLLAPRRTGVWLLGLASCCLLVLDGRLGLLIAICTRTANAMNVEYIGRGMGHGGSPDIFRYSHIAWSVDLSDLTAAVGRVVRVISGRSEWQRACPKRWHVPTLNAM